MAKTDIFIEITYNVNETRKTVIRTNAKPDKVGEVLQEWLRTQVGQGQDLRKINSRYEYKISIKLDLIDDSFYTTSDTGNSGLTAGVVMYVSLNLNKFQISPLR